MAFISLLFSIFFNSLTSSLFLLPSALFPLTSSISLQPSAFSPLTSSLLLLPSSLIPLPSYFIKFAIVAIMVAIEATPVPSAIVSVVVIRLTAFWGTTISQPGRNLVLFFTLATSPFI